MLFRRTAAGPQVLLAHLGGPYFAAKDLNAWGVPKGEVEEDEDVFEAAKREFSEETGLSPGGPFIALDSVKQKSGKVVHAWAVEGDFDPARLVSNTFELEWPRGSGRLQAFPEIDRAEWFSFDVARKKIISAQAVFLDRLAASLGSPFTPTGVTGAS